MNLVQSADNKYQSISRDLLEAKRSETIRDEFHVNTV
jgi:hypothetical protein